MYLSKYLHLAIVAMFSRIWATSAWLSVFMHDIFPLNKYIISVEENNNSGKSYWVITSDVLMQLLIPLRFDFIWSYFEVWNLPEGWVIKVYLIYVWMFKNLEDSKIDALSAGLQILQNLDWWYLFYVFLLNYFDVQGRNILECLQTLIYAMEIFSAFLAKNILAKYTFINFNVIVLFFVSFLGRTRNAYLILCLKFIPVN